MEPSTKVSDGRKSERVPERNLTRLAVDWQKGTEKECFATVKQLLVCRELSANEWQSGFWMNPTGTIELSSVPSRQ